jgi:hypothetical protein
MVGPILMILGLAALVRLVRLRNAIDTSGTDPSTDLGRTPIVLSGIAAGTLLYGYVGIEVSYAQFAMGRPYAGSGLAGVYAVATPVLVLGTTVMTYARSRSVWRSACRGALALVSVIVAAAPIFIVMVLGNI